MTTCQNCGHESLCGVDYRREERDWRGKLLGEIVVCKCCRCEECSETSWPGPGV